MPGDAWPALPVFVRVAGRAVVLVGEGEATDAKRRLLERAGAVVVGEEDYLKPRPFRGGVGVGDTDQSLDSPTPNPSPEGEGLFPILAIVVDDAAAADRLKARGLLVNVVDRPELCDFTLPAIVDRAPVLVAVGTGGVSAGLAAALRQWLEALLPATLGRLADALYAARGELRARFPDAAERRRALGAALAPGGALDPLAGVSRVVALDEPPPARTERVLLASTDPDDLTLRQARWLAQADRVTHRADVPAAIVDRARADATRLVTAAPLADDMSGLTVDLALAEERE